MRAIKTLNFRFLPPALMISAALLTLLVNGCAPFRMQPPSSPAPAQRSATSGLISEGRELLANGDVERAGATFERALRIESRNPESWYGLAQVRFAQHRYGQTIGLCRKALTLPTVDQTVHSSCTALISAAESKGR